MRQFKIYVDMDGVLTDWNQAVKNLGPKAAKGLSDNATFEEKKQLYNYIEQAKEDFWVNMKWLPKAQDLWAWLRQFKPIILSSPGNFTWAPSGKIQWLKKNLPEAQLYLEDDKWRYAEPNAILIDDTKENIDAWESMGGIGILHTDPASTKDKVLQAIQNISPSRAEMIITYETLKNMKDKLSMKRCKRFYPIANQIKEIVKHVMAYKGDPARERIIKHVIPKIIRRPYKYDDAVLILNELKSNIIRRNPKVIKLYEEAVELCKQKSNRTYEALNKLIAAMEEEIPSNFLPQPTNPYRPILHLQPIFASFIKKALETKSSSTF